MTTYLLGAADPEMNAIEALLLEQGAEIIYARAPSGERVTPSSAYGGWEPPPEVTPVVTLHDFDCFPGELRRRGGDTEVWQSLPQGGSVCTTYPAGVVLVECCPRGGYPGAVVIDHHRPGDPGYARPRAEAVAASSLGQIAARLGVDLTPRQRVIAALDHHLPGALQGECVGVSAEDALTEVLSRPGAPTPEQLAEARAALAGAPLLPWSEGCPPLRDLRGVVLPARGPTDRGAYPGVTLAASLAGEGYVTLVATRSGESYPAKLVLGGEASPAVAHLLSSPGEWVPPGYEQAGAPYGVPGRGIGGLPLRHSRVAQ